jgi:hypothetical protein
LFTVCENVLFGAIFASINNYWSQLKDKFAKREFSTRGLFLLWLIIPGVSVVCFELFIASFAWFLSIGIWIDILDTGDKLQCSCV